MTEQMIRDAAEAPARYRTEFAPVWCYGNLMFGAVTWRMDLPDQPYESARLLLLACGYRA
jgi:hypothetical protein